MSPEGVRKLTDLGFDVRIEKGAGIASEFSDAALAEAGATIVDVATAIYSECDIVLKVRRPTVAEAQQLKEGATLVCLLMLQEDDELRDVLLARKVNVVALERVPRITRAQKMDVLSAMGNIAGHRAVIEAAGAYGDFVGAQMTAAGASQHANVLVIGVGVAGLAAMAAAKSLGAEVRAFDTRLATKDQVKSMGATFLELEFEESGEGEGGYAKVMSKEFIDAEMALFREQAREVDIIITTAQIPGRKAPVLITRDMVESMKPGSVVVDLAAETGGNCECTVAGEMATVDGVRIIGYTDMASRMSMCASRFFATCIVNLLKEMSPNGQFTIDQENEIVRGALVISDGREIPPPPPPATPKKTAAAPEPEAKPAQEHIMEPNRIAWGTTAGGLIVIILLFVLSRFAPKEFLEHLTVFILACFVGWQVVWSVTPALHTPLMSVTNAISGIIIVGGMLQAGTGDLDLAAILGAVAVLVASINIVGGFLVTRRMLKMFRKDAA